MELGHRDEGGSSVRKGFFVAAMISIVALGIAASASAFEGGGRKPSEAPTVVVGQHNTGQLNNHRNDANYNGDVEVAFWRLPPLSTRDVVSVDWHSVPFTKYPGEFPICMTLVQGIDDFSWGSIFEHRRSCESSGPVYELPGSGTAHTEITVQEATTNSSYLEFFAYANATNPSEYETFPYDFTLGPILHYLGIALKPVKRVSAAGVIRATANLANGQPAPDGLAFDLSATWSGGVASYTGLSSGGVVSFQLALPETAYGKNAHFVASHPADGTYQAVVTPQLTVKVAKPKAPPPSPCERAESRVLALKRQLQRLRRHARYAFGAQKRRLNRRAKRVQRQLRAARRQAQALCAA
jgi:hypothetical protein